jgi:pimeloyl-ACP methyl ester carboxylesterase
VVVGHSFGGQTAWLFSGPTFDDAAIDTRCAGNPPCDEAGRDAYRDIPGDPRVVAVAPMAGDAGTELVAESGWAGMRGPVLYMTGTEDFDGAPQYARTAAGDVTWLEVDGACHESFTSTGVPCPTLDKAEGHTAIATYLEAFVAAHALGSEEPAVVSVLDGTTEVSAAISVHRD